jgi:hypothetical protein
MKLSHAPDLRAGRSTKARMITVFPAPGEWLVKGDATEDFGSELRRFPTRELALEYARTLANESRPSLLSVESRDGSTE